MERSEKEITIRSEEVQDILNKVPSKLIRWGSIIFLGLIVLMICLLWLVKYPDVITAEAYLTTDPPPQKIYARVDAKIDTILLFDKDYVSKNTVIAILENSSDNKDVLFLKSILDTITLTPGQVFFPFKELPLLFLGEVELQFSEFENAYFEYSMNRDLKPFDGKIRANNTSLAELKNRLKNLISQKEISRRELGIIKKDLDRYKALLKKGIVSQQMYENKQVVFYTASREYENAIFLISQIKESIGNSRRDSQNIDFTKYRDENQLLKKVLHSYKELKRTISDWELKYVLKSRDSGILSFVEYLDKNYNVSKGDLLFTVSPSHTPFYIAKVKTPKVNAGKLKIGQHVNLELNDYPDYEFGVLKGSVSNISNVSDENGAYIVDVKITKDLKTTFGNTIAFKQEMKGTADIITEDLRLLERLFYQFKDLYSK
ncbi:HlyD family secretion protein [Jejuia pallidilutea]|uniref:HlyD family secretion protein n=1 Tax=Jejuia pallidilutea TaxID=504487 RepID=A0A362X005_9FLAO|nr:HlyD family secretion protein [Jejuia pallidilutea]PQV48816.1 HlyD family secretion protein [Jejuia pallidilutea]